MKSNSGIEGVYRRGSAFVAQFTDERGEMQQRRFADKWEAARWREAAIEGRAEERAETLGDSGGKRSQVQILSLRPHFPS